MSNTRFSSRSEEFWRNYKMKQLQNKIDELLDVVRALSSDVDEIRYETQRCRDTLDKLTEE